MNKFVALTEKGYNLMAIRDLGAALKPLIEGVGNGVEIADIGLLPEIRITTTQSTSSLKSLSPT